MQKRQLEPADETVSASKVARTETEVAKYICVSFLLNGMASDPYLSYVKSIELSKLFSSEHHDNIESVSQDVRAWSETWDQHKGIGMVVATDGSLYVAFNECQHPAGLEQSLKLFKHRLVNHRFEQQVDDCHGKFTTCKPFPVLVEIKQRIYGLSVPRHDVELIVNPFEVYDLTHHEWKTLEPPPLTSKSRYYPFFGSDPIMSYAVVGKYLCVSSSIMSFAFDTESEKWERCDLFLKVSARKRPSGYGNFLSRIAKYRKSRGEVAADEIGVPFPGVYACMEYEGYLLCVMFPYGYNVVAFKIVQGNLEEEPIILLELTLWQRFSYESSFVALGGGEFCLIAPNENALTFTKFKVVKKSGGGLTCAKADVQLSTISLTDDINPTLSCYGAVAR